MSDKKSRPSYTAEQKAEVKKLLQASHTHEKVVELTGVGKGTVVKIAAELKGKEKNPTTKPKSASTSPTDVFKAELEAIQMRKLEIEELLKGTLKLELEALTEKETTIQKLLTLYQ